MPTSHGVAYGVSQSSLDCSQEAEVTRLNENNQLVHPQVEVTYYTDPLCSWSWALEPQWRRLRYEFADQLAWRYSMGGLISDWQQFSDPLNDISRPVQMGPQWIQIRHLIGMPIDERIWVEDPPASSYPACIAFKAAERQGASVGEAYLRRLREAVMLERRNIAQWEVLLALAEEVSASSGFDLEQFRYDLDGKEVLEAFRTDIKDGRYRGIGRFPSLILRPTTGQSILLIGYRPYQVLREAIAHIAPEMHPVRSVTDVVAYASYWQRITAKEVAAALDLELEAARKALDEAVANGHLIEAGQIYLTPANLHSL